MVGGSSGRGIAREGHLALPPSLLDLPVAAVWYRSGDCGQDGRPHQTTYDMVLVCEPDAESLDRQKVWELTLQSELAQCGSNRGPVLCLFALLVLRVEQLVHCVLNLTGNVSI